MTLKGCLKLNPKSSPKKLFYYIGTFTENPQDYSHIYGKYLRYVFSPNVKHFVIPTY